MDLSSIFTIPGKAGLFKLITQSKQSAVMESFVDNKRFSIFGLDKISSLEEIAIYTEDKEYPLIEMFRDIFKKEEGKELSLVNGSDAEIKDYFSQVLPNYDTEKVYVSNMKKVLQWYNVLLKHSLIDMELSPREKAIKEIEEENKKASE